jgi:hypothetical protein
VSKSKLTKLPSLEDCTAGLSEEWKTVHALSRKAKYRTIALGLWLIKAQEIHRVAPGANQARSGGKFTDCPTVGQSGSEGFDAWLQSTCANLGFSRGSGYNWLNAALNAGLTPASTLADVKELEDQDALADRKLSAHDLYSPPRLQEGSPEEASAKKKLREINRPEVKAQQEWFPFYEQLAFYGTDEKETNLLYHLPLTSIDPRKEVSLNDLEQNLENALARVREIKKERIQSLKSAA